MLIFLLSPPPLSQDGDWRAFKFTTVVHRSLVVLVVYLAISIHPCDVRGAVMPFSCLLYHLRKGERTTLIKQSSARAVVIHPLPPILSIVVHMYSTLN